MRVIEDSLFKLELVGRVTADDVRKAYRRLVRQWHPDRYASKNDPQLTREATERLREINEAYQALNEFLDGGSSIESGSVIPDTPWPPYDTDVDSGERTVIVEIRHDDDYYTRREFLEGCQVILTNPIHKGDGWYCVHVAFEKGSRQLAAYAEGALFAGVRLRRVRG